MVVFQSAKLQRGVPDVPRDQGLLPQMPLQTNCAAVKAVESLAADFVECLNPTVEIGAAVGAVS